MTTKLITHEPEGVKIISRLSTLLRSAVLPEVRSSKTALFNRFDSIAKNGVDNLKNISLEVIWPEPDAVSNVSGKNDLFIVVNRYSMHNK